MSESPEQFNTYSKEKAQEEAQKMQEKISKGEAKDYDEAEVQIEHEDKKEILEKRPLDEDIKDPRAMDLPETPKPVKWKDLATGEIFTSYPAICHDVHPQKGYMIDRWIIKWFDNSDEAKSVDTEARQEANSYVISRKIYLEIAKGAKEVELPLKIPELAEKKLSPQEILSLAGFSEKQYRIRDDIAYWHDKGIQSRWDRYEGLIPGREASTELARKAEDGIWDIGGAEGVEQLNLFRSIRGAKSVLSAMGLTDEKIDSIKARIQLGNEKEEDVFKAEVREFASELKKLPAFLYLSLDLQERVNKFNNFFYIGEFFSVVEELKKEWSIAEKLRVMAEQGEILVNWGGHFRQMGRSDNAQYWVLRPDGKERYPDKVKYRGNYTSEGEKFWRVVDKDELAISWSKINSSTPHDFTVNHLPINKLSNEQLTIVAELEEKIAKEWEGVRSMSGKPSPSIGEGWRITGRKSETELHPLSADKEGRDEVVKKKEREPSTSVFKTANSSSGSAMEAALRKAGFTKKD